MLSEFGVLLLIWLAVNKASVLTAIAIILFAILALRLAQMQIVDHSKYKLLAENNTTKYTIIRAPRGVIYDRSHRILATSKQSLSVLVYPFKLKTEKQKLEVASRLSRILNINYDDLLKLLLEMEPTTPMPMTLDKDIPVSTAIKIIENRRLLPGIEVEYQALRYYPLGETAGHLLGFVGQISEADMKSERFAGLRMGDIVGKDGLEKAFDEELRGVKGEKRIPIDRFGKIAEPEKYIKEPIKGKDIELTIDLDLQKIAEDALRSSGVRGAAVVVDPYTGEILALASEPSFDPNIFTKPVSSAMYQSLVGRQAFLNRALSAYTPGSIWKPVTAIAAIEHGVTTGSERLQVGASVMLAGIAFGDWTSKSEIVNMEQAIAMSRNTYFYQLAKRMTPEWIAEQGRKMGAGRLTHIELIGENEGLLPDPAWKRRKYHEPWFPGNTLHLSIGQSFLLLSPLQVAKIYSALATGGRVPQLHLIKNPEKEKPESIVAIDPKALTVVRNGLKACIASGTGTAAKLDKVVVAGKTGSAEVQGFTRTTHAWFAAYAPASAKEKAEIVVVVVGEGAGHGGAIAAPIAKKILDGYFQLQLSSDVKQSSIANP